MIDNQVYTIGWIEQVSKKHLNADKILIEKVIRALSLLEELKKSGLSFVFKGGTALMLMLGVPKRLSIDIDIILPEIPENMETIFDKIIMNSPFKRYSQQDRIVDSGIEKAHYKFYYEPAFKTYSDEDYILLDILYEAVPYNQRNEIPIASSFIKVIGEPETVNVPSFEDILADKLTAFAPNTTGIPYFKKGQSMSMEILKQLYDIGNLFNEINDISETKDVFNHFAKTELNYRRLIDLNPNDVLDDIIETAHCISVRGTSGKCNFSELQSGIQKVKQFIISGKFQIDQAIVAASKAAYLAALIKSGKTDLVKFTDFGDINKLLISNEKFTKLNKLKKNNPEAFCYWHQAAMFLE
ncbi:MAG: nucleotidyl transferase AbiEii/AbiGii toxin family protein [Bacteroidales bacterium]